ncbi:MAG: 6-carboxytetrahydropterin synthase [Rickettsiales bacterium]
MKISCVRRIEFDAAHRIMNHESKCKYLHGHRYAIEATFCADDLDDLGRIVDFSIIKEKLGKWLDDNWDHATILYEKDQQLGKAISGVTEQKIFYLQNNPTAENMASYLIGEICPQLFSGLGICCTHIRLYETPNCSVEVTIT